MCSREEKNLTDLKRIAQSELDSALRSLRQEQSDYESKISNMEATVRMMFERNN